MASMDIFNANAFGMQTLTAAINDRAHLPTRIGDLAIFQYEGVRTLDVSVERKGNTLVLVKTSERGGPAV